jgi:predicted ATPase/DNA-binding SARP family transcriptional activator
MSRLSLALLGHPVITLDGQAITTFKTLKAQLLLAFLAVEAEHPHRREELTGLLWPEHSEEAARANLRMSLHRLREALQEEDLKPFLHTTRNAIQFSTQSDHWLDVNAFQEFILECQRHAHNQLEKCEECGARLMQAADLYRGDFLAGVALSTSIEFEEWVLVQRESLRRQALGALEALAIYHEGRDEYDLLCGSARKQLELEPWHEPAHRALMRGLALAGDRNAALAHYETCRRQLEEELGVEPDIETRSLVESIRLGAISPANAIPATPIHNLPTQLTPFIGREFESTELHELLQNPELRLLTLVGAGGMGKTRLAFELARSRLNQYRDGVFLVSLTPVTSAQGIAPAIASAMKLQLYGEPEPALLHVLQDKQILLILDNCEQLLTEEEGAASTNLVVRLLQSAPQVHILATSREPLQVHGEQIFRLQGLEYAKGATLEEAAISPGVRLLVQSARRALPSFKLEVENVQHILRICQLVEGMPLGIELAAVWLGTLSPAEIASEIEHSADFLSSEWRDVPERQQSMRAVFDWSWGLLNQAEQQVFRQLSVFRGGFTREAAQAVTGASLMMLTRLVRKSLLSHRERARYEIHELLRQFAAEQLDVSQVESAEIEAQHSKFYLNFAAARELRLGRNEPRQAAAEIRSEIDNIRQAWELSHAQIQDLELSAYALWQFYILTGMFSEAERIFRLSIESLRGKLAGENEAGNRTEVQHILGKLLGMQAWFLTLLSQHDLAMMLAQEAITLGETSDGIEAETLGHLVWGQAYSRKAQSLASRPHFLQVIELASKNPNKRSELLIDCEWIACLLLGVGSRVLGDYASAEKEMIQGLQLCFKLGKVRGEMNVLVNLGDIAGDRGDFIAARERYSQAHDLAHSLNYRWGEGVAQLGLSNIARRQGNYVLAASLVEHSRSNFRESGDKLKESISVAMLGYLYIYIGDFENAQKRIEEFLQLLPAGEAPHTKAWGNYALVVLAYHRGEHETVLVYAEQFLKIMREMGIPLDQAEALVLLGHANAALYYLEDAASSYQQALELYEELGHTTYATEPRAGLARVALLENDLAGSLAYVEEIMNVLSDRPHAGIDEPFYVYLTCYRVLEANHDPRAASVLENASSLLDKYASHFTEESQRHAFLYNVPSHRELIEAIESVRSTRD